MTNIIVTFDPSCGLAPLTTKPSTANDDIERYLQRAFPGPLTVQNDDDEGRGLVLADGRLTAAFTIAPLGGTQQRRAA